MRRCVKAIDSVRRRARRSLVAAVAVALCGFPGTVAAQQVEEGSALAASLERIREATERYADPSAAVEAGYVPDPMYLCISAPVEGYPPQLGGMGLHYFRPDLLGITAERPRVAGTGTHTDFADPGVLVYVPGEDGRLRLGAVENIVFQEPWHAAGNSEPPSFEGLEYWAMRDNPETPDVDEAHAFAPHHELHLWVHIDNPSGVAMPFNPAVSCEAFDGPKTMEEAMERMKSQGPGPDRP